MLINCSSYLLHHVAWSVDILFISIIQNKTSPRAQKDITLLGKVVKLFEMNDSKHDDAMPYRISKALYRVAMDGVQDMSLEEGVPLAVTAATESLEPLFPDQAEGSGMRNGSPLHRQQTNAVPSTFPHTPLHVENPDTGEQYSDSSFVSPEWNIPIGLEAEFWHEQYFTDNFI